VCSRWTRSKHSLGRVESLGKKKGAVGPCNFFAPTFERSRRDAEFVLNVGAGAQARERRTCPCHDANLTPRADGIMQGR